MRHTLDIQRFRASTPKDHTPKGAHEETTHRLRQTFMGDKRPSKLYDTHASWDGLRFRHIGSNMGTAYASDKWGGEKKKSFEEFKHISEGPQELYMREGAITDFPTFGPVWSPAKDSLKLPDVVADLAPILHLEARLFTSLDKRGQGAFGQGDAGCRRISVGASMLCAGYLIDAENDDYGEPFLVVIAKKGGVQFVILGKKLDVTKDGIVG